MGDRSLSVTFVRGARRVTGSNFLLEAGNTRILIDCGLVQGEMVCDPANGEKFSYDPASIDALVVTHAHADHIGLIPKLVKAGFRGSIYATAPTAALMPVMLADTARLIAAEAEHCGTEAPYVPADVEAVVPHLAIVEYGKPVSVGPITITLHNAGHILGSATVLAKALGTSILFTGDLGRDPAILVQDREVVPAEYLVIESVYGDRLHESVEEAQHTLANAIERTTREKGTLLIPSFSLERTQILLESLKDCPIPVFMDSPLAEKVTEVYTRFPEYLKHPVSASVTTLTPADEGTTPKVILAGAGMSTGGRIRAHEKRYLPDTKNTLLIVGYQTPGSLGRRIADGARKVKIDDTWVTVRAKVMSTGGFSAHADRDDLLSFAEAVKPTEAFVVLGEMSASTFLAQRLSGFLGIKTVIPQEGERYELQN